MRKIVFLDLEDTVIDEFNKVGFAALVNIPQVKAFIEAESPDEVRLFSFALWNDHCVKQFGFFFEERLNRALGVKFAMADVFTTEKLFLMCRRRGLIFEDQDECMLFHGKQYGFQRYIELSKEFDDQEVVLLDDSVETHSIHYPNRNLRLRMVNVAEL